MAAALADDAHVDAQRERYRARRERLAAAVRTAGLRDRPLRGRACTCGPPATRTAGRRSTGSPGLGIVAAPGSFYGPAGSRHVRLALTATDERIAAAVERLAPAPA